MMFSIVMFVCLVLCTGINYLLLKRTGQNRDGLLLGVTLPPEAAALPEVQEIMRKYKRQLRIICLVCCAVGVLLLLFLKVTTSRVFLWMDFFLLSMFLPYLPSFWAGKALKALRDEKGWPVAPEDAGWKLQLFYYNPADKCTSGSTGQRTRKLEKTLFAPISGAFLCLIGGIF